MERTIAAFDARRQSGKLLDDVRSRGESIVIERHGEKVAVVVPLAVYEGWKAERQALFDFMRATSARAGLTPGEAASIAAEAVRAVRTRSD